MTTDDLRRKIAELEGWTDVRFFACSRAWEGTASGREYVERLPDWPADANAALALLEKMADDAAAANVVVKAVGLAKSVKYRASFVFAFWARARTIEAEGDTFPIAICRLYVAWAKARFTRKQENVPENPGYISNVACELKKALGVDTKDKRK